MSEFSYEESVHSQLSNYRVKKKQKRMIKGVIIAASVALLLLLFSVFLSKYLFSVRTLTAEGSEHYTEQELLDASGIHLGDSIFSLSENAVEEKLKKAFPYVKSVTLEKDYPDGVKLVIKEEYITFAYDMLGEFYLFNHGLFVMDRFSSLEDLFAVRQAIVVKMPLPKSCIVSQGIQFSEESTYIYDFVEALSLSSVRPLVKEIDLCDRFVIKMTLEGVTVEFGDYTFAEEKLFALYRLLGESGQKMTGHIDLSCYPRCFYDLKPENNS